MSREPNKCLYVINFDYFRDVVDWDDFFSTSKIDDLIKSGNAFKVEPGYQWRIYTKYVDNLTCSIIPLLSCFIDKFNIKITVYNSDGYSKVKTLYEQHVKNVNTISKSEFKKDEEYKLIKTNYELNKELEEHSKPLSSASIPYKHNVVVNLPINGEKTVNLIDCVFKPNGEKYKLDLEQVRISEILLSSGKPFMYDGQFYNTGHYSTSFDSRVSEVTGTYNFDLNPENGVLKVDTCQIDTRKDFAVSVTINFNLIEKDTEEIVSGPWNEPEKVKAIRETIETVMKNHDTTDIREIDMDMLSSCINATLNREKQYYKWLNEFTNEEVDEAKIRFAFKFLDWVIMNKTGRTNDGGMYFVDD